MEVVRESRKLKVNSFLVWVFGRMLLYFSRWRSVNRGIGFLNKEFGFRYVKLKGIYEFIVEGSGLVWR